MVSGYEYETTKRDFTDYHAWIEATETNTFKKYIKLSSDKTSANLDCYILSPGSAMNI